MDGSTEGDGEARTRQGVVAAIRQRTPIVRTRFSHADPALRTIERHQADSTGSCT